MTKVYSQTFSSSATFSKVKVRSYTKAVGDVYDRNIQ